MNEKNYEFRKRMLIVHKHGFRNDSKWQSVSGTVLNNVWEIVYPENLPAVMEYVARDMAEFLADSLSVYVRVRATDNIEQERWNPCHKILLTTGTLSADLAPNDCNELSYRLVSNNESIIVCGNSARGTAQGVYFIQDRMKVHEGPVLEYLDIQKTPLFTTRMVHSGYGLDMYPDEHLRAIARNGITAILVFVNSVDHTPHGYLDFNELIYRAQRYGLDVYAYSFMHSLYHPSDPRAKEHYESTYGTLFNLCPGLKGVVFVGESCEFPSTDEHVVPYNWEYVQQHPELNPNHLPSPGWYPCCDYPQWLDLIKTIIRAHKPDADCVFWTYNWGYVNKEARLKLIRSLPTDISLLVTFEMFETFQKPNGVTVKCVDYTISFEGPGEYFTSEAEEAHKRGIPLYAMSNTGGLTWDFGVVPYLPCPQQWHRRNIALGDAKDKWGLCGLMDSHHYGFFPSIVSELAKIEFWTPRVDYDTALNELIARDFGDENVESMKEVYADYSNAIRKYVPTNSDQYGACRIGPAYPLLYKKEAILESKDYAHFKNNTICNTMYSYETDKLDNLHYEIDSFSNMESLLNHGNVLLEQVAQTLTGRKREETDTLLGIGKFMEYTVHTVVNVKKWFLLKIQLGKLGTDNTRTVQCMVELAADEIANARRTIPLVEADSRLGFEPSMEYMCDTAHLQWKIKHTQAAIDEITAEYSL